jgi:flagellar biosynthetic protein FliR
MAMTVGIRLAAPAMVALFLISIAMGFLAKTIPQLNILTIGFAIRVVVGLVITILSLNGVEDVFVTALDDGFALLRETFAVGRT